jgi:hypothetical protein
MTGALPERFEPGLVAELDEPVRRYFAQEFGYIPCGAEVHEERSFGGITIPSAFTVGWWFDTPRYAPFFEARIVDAVVVA